MSSPDLHKEIVGTLEDMKKIDERKASIMETFEELHGRKERASEPQVLQHSPDQEESTRRKSEPLRRVSPIAVPGERAKVESMEDIPLPAYEQQPPPVVSPVQEESEQRDIIDTSMFKKTGTGTAPDRPLYSSPLSAHERPSSSKPQIRVDGVQGAAAETPASLTSSASKLPRKRSSRLCLGIMSILQLLLQIVLALFGVTFLVFAVAIWTNVKTDLTYRVTARLVYIGICLFILAIVGSISAFAMLRRRSASLIYLIVLLACVGFEFWTMVQFRKALLIGPSTISANWDSLSSEQRASIQEYAKCCGWNALDDRVGGDSCGFALTCRNVVEAMQLQMDTVVVALFIGVLFFEGILALLNVITCIIS